VNVLTNGKLVRDKEGSNGKVTVAGRLSRVNPMSTGIMSIVNKGAGQLKSNRYLADEVVETKREVERLLGER